MSAFTVVHERTIEVITYERVVDVILETDDWMEAERMALVKPGRPLYRIRGAHPTHEFAGGVCVNCRARDNGSYGSHAPCGYDFKGRPLIVILGEA